MDVKDALAIARKCKIKDINLKAATDLHWDLTTNGNLRATFNNVRLFFETDENLKDLFRYNLFAENIELVRKTIWDTYAPIPRFLNDNDITNIKEYLRAKEIEPSINTISEAVSATALRNSYNPVMDYLNSLKWDGVSRLDNWLSVYCGAENNAYTRNVGKMTLVAACARIDKPGCKYDYLVILEGGQGIGKSQLVQKLGGPWFEEINLLEVDKETVERMQGAWIIEVPELECFRKKDVDSLKSFLTRPKDKVRLPYAKRSGEFPRKSIFIGTINPEARGYLRDITGNRRFLPIRLSQINLPEFMKDRDQLFAEAFEACNAGFPLYITDKIVKGMAVKEQAQREVYDDLEPEVCKWVKNNARCHGYFITSAEIFKGVMGGDFKNFDSGKGRRIAAIMKSLGYGQPVQKRIDDENKRGYDVSILEPEDHKSVTDSDVVQESKEEFDWDD